MKRIDFYTKVHKGLRAGLFAVSQRAAALDYADSTSVQALAAELRALLGRLSAHAAHEARFIHPLLLQKIGESCFDPEHAALELEQDSVGHALARLIAAPAEEREQSGLALYRTLNRFICNYLGHLEREEAIMPLLHERCSDAELANVMTRFGASRSPQETLADLRWMLPALNPMEQGEMLAGAAKAP
jgi:hypothetical protein